MGRWQPGGQGRLAVAALDLFAERGFDQVTVADIAARAGLTERTFFRYFADKREVLFGWSGVFDEVLRDAVASAPAAASALDLASGAVAAVVERFDDREHSCRRQAIITAHSELRERELIKLASWATVLATALRERGVSEPAATLSAEAAIAVFRNAFDRWVTPGETRDLAALTDDSFAVLRSLATGG